jgi:serine phosphatase RsbU (regulator of sigma subunit)
MPSRLSLPGRTDVPAGTPAERLRRFLTRRWPGRILLAALLLAGLAGLGVPVPALLLAASHAVLWLFGIYAGLRFLLFASRRLLWRIRTKLILSYLFIAVVPVVLLTAFFLLAGLLFSGLVASHLVSSEIGREAEALRAAARAAVEAPPGAEATAVEAHLAPIRDAYPDAAYAVVRDGRVLASAGGGPRALPSWWVGPGFEGLVRVSDRDRVRGAWSSGGSFAVVDVPLDTRLFGELERRYGIRLLSAGGRVEKRGGGLTIEIDGDAKELEGPVERISGTPFIATPERTDWETGKREPEPVIYQFDPYQLLLRLSPGTLNMGDTLVKALTVVGVVFLVMYAGAFALGLLLARSVTRSVHALSLATRRVLEGDFTYRIKVRSRDQLGELAESFNMMGRGIQDLLREQSEKERLEEELRIARQIQMSLLPQSTAGVRGLRIAALCLPAEEVGGDYYDLLPLGDTRMGVLVADVSGKGTSAALYMAELKGLVLSLSAIYDSPAKLLIEANRILTANMDSRSFITMTYAVVDVEARTMRYARAGHSPILHFQAATGRTRVLAPQGLGLGMDPGPRFREILEEAETPLPGGDVFLFFTDGLSEAMSPQAELFGEGRLRAVLESSEQLGTEEIKERILSEIRDFVGDAAQHDDMTLVLLKVV